MHTGTHDARAAGARLETFVSRAARYLLGSSLAITPSAASIDPVLESLLSFHPGWITRSVTTHDPAGGNDDGYRPGVALEGEHRVLFHARGEGRITRIWMTAPRAELEKPGQELWIEIDGRTVFRGSHRDFFEGRGLWTSPLALGVDASSGAFTSYVPFAWSSEAKIRFRGVPIYYQVTYREGPGAASGPSSEELAQFMAEDWTRALPAPSRQQAPSPGAPLVLAEGPATVSGLVLHIPAASLKDLEVRIGGQPPVPASFFFGLASASTDSDGGWATFRSALHAAWAPDAGGTGRLATRLPVPLAEGEALSLEVAQGGAIARLEAAVAVAPARRGVRLLAQYRDQTAPGRETTMPLFESDEPLQLVALLKHLSGGLPNDRTYLEGDEMIRTDGMSLPLQIGTGTEDYFNGGFYFLGAHSNAFSGLHRFLVIDPEEGWKRARFVHSLYRLHVADPIVSRSGLRFGIEAGPTGAYTPLQVRSLGLAYTFSDHRVIGEQEVRVQGRRHRVRSAVDAERSEKPRIFRFREGRGITRIEVACPPEARGLLLLRAYSAAKAPQTARVRLDGREVGTIHEMQANPVRSIAEDALWIDLRPGQCGAGRRPVIEVDATGSPEPWSEGGYRLRFFSGPPAPQLTHGPAVEILDTDHLPEGAAYVNDHTTIQLRDGRWMLTGIFNAEGQPPETERVFVLATAPGPGPARWHDAAAPSFSLAPERFSTRALADERWIWAPHVVHDRDGSLVMIFHVGTPDPDRSGFRIARSRDGFTWTREAGTLFEDICVARDPMLVRLGELWVVYYTRCASLASRQSGVAYRTSTDLARWSPPAMALTLGPETAMHNSGHTESPFVFARQGWFYLTITSYPVDYDATFVYRSRSPFSFPPHAVARLRAHAAEWVGEGGSLGAGRLFFTHAGRGKGGVFLQELFGL
ncbi:hypothetical protein SOCE26_066330 [Sorangium cellulosum]|uniref:DUF2961 domain-containing protein n=1 Tax=Sorangium cellulosum TaxID=56 RepID=A0A2L0F0Q9_SORCE|nr:DUF2961 domain-containing protein [Sorangium cellulosum]AUX45152.1 hypothetical protein SOCE26_066330 [Sorangium cellulosum]